MRNKKRIGLSLSGGGFRAAVYHLGTLKKLNEMGILIDLDVISSVSGGSITSAYYGLYGQNFPEFEKGLKNALRSNVIKSVLISPGFLLIAIIILFSLLLMLISLFTAFAWIASIILVAGMMILLKFQFKILPISKIIEDIYNRSFFNNKCLNDFIDKPVIAINSTNLETGRLFTFSKLKMGDSAYAHPKPGDKSIRFNSEKFPISKAVAASACVPFAFTPIRIEPQYFCDKSDAKIVNPRLIDGGVYDNQGIHKITQAGSSYECDIIITSDAGNMLPYRSRFRNTFELLIRTSDIFMNRIKNFQLIENVYKNSKSSTKEIAYFSLGWDIDKCIPGFIDNLKKGTIPLSVIDAHGITKEDIDSQKWKSIEDKLKTDMDYQQLILSQPLPNELKIARSVKTSLKNLKDSEINALIKHAYYITELQIKLYCPSLTKI
jgi:NTE family protein